MSTPPLVLSQSHVNVLCLRDKMIHCSVSTHSICQIITIIKDKQGNTGTNSRAYLFLLVINLSRCLWRTSSFTTQFICLLLYGSSSRLVFCLLNEMNHTFIQEESSPFVPTCWWFYPFLLQFYCVLQLFWRSSIPSNPDLYVATTLFCLDYCHSSIISF